MRALVGVFALGAALAGCGGCSRSNGEPAARPADAAVTVVAEALPRCRADAPRLALPEGAVVGDVAVGEAALWLGLVHADGARRRAAVLRAGADLAAPRTLDLGPAFGDDPPPTPRLAGGVPYAAWLERATTDGGPRVRTLLVARLGDDAAKVEARIEQQADESTAFDVAWSDGQGLAAWDEDAPNLPDAAYPSLSERGFVKVASLADGKPRVASPPSSDADSPQLLARPGGFWLAWLARRIDEAPGGIEGPGEDKSFRWVEALALDAKGDPAGPVRRVSSERGRAVAFSLGRSGGELVVVVQDEAAVSEGGGARLVRYVVGGSGVAPGADMVDGGVGHALADVVAAPTGAARWLAWSDVAEHAHLTALGDGLLPSAAAGATAEPALDGARVLGEGKDGMFVLSGDRPELRRFTCR